MKWSNKTVLITGGAGFIGSSIADKLVLENAEVTILDDLSTGNKENIPKNVHKIIMGNVCDTDFITKLRDIDYIFHFGSPSSSVLYKKDPKLCITNSIYGFLNIMELSKQIGIKKLVYPSSCTVYGNTPSPQSEVSPLQPNTTYAISKVACEYLANLFSNDFPSIGLRIFSGYGSREIYKEGFNSVVTRFLLSIIENKRPTIFGNGEQTRDFIYIDDIVEAAIKGAEISYSGIVNVGSGNSTTFNQLIKMINSLLKKDVNPIYIKTPLNYVHHKQAEIKKMKKMLRINPLSLKEGLTRYLSSINKSVIPSEHIF